MLQLLIDRVLHSGYEAAKARSLLSVIGRFSRGNTAVQDLQIIDEAELVALRAEGDKALRRLADERFV